MSFMTATMDIDINEIPDNHYLVVHPLDDQPEEKVDTSMLGPDADDHQREAFADGAARLPDPDGSSGGLSLPGFGWHLWQALTV